MEENTIQIATVDDAAFFASHLFKQAFNEYAPTTPVHYVAFAKLSPTTFEVAGYYHVAYHEEYALVGGLCVDPRYRNQGIGERLSHFVFGTAGGRKAFFAYIGNPTSEGIAARIGYLRTQYKHLWVRWVNSLPEEEQQRLVAEVAALGPF